MKNQNSRIENFFRFVSATIFISLFLALFGGLRVEAEGETATLNIRFEDSMIYSGQIPLTTTTYYDIINEIEHNLTGTSTVFSTLVNADKISEAFAITDAVYNDGWSSFYLRCLTLETATTTVACDNWNYTVDGVYPSVGLDKYLLLGGETIYLFFSTPWQITATTSTFPLGTTTTFQTWRYQYDDLQNPTAADGNNTVDLSITNPNSTGWWDANLTIATLTTDDTGAADYLFASTGTFFARIAPSDYSKWSNPITITVFDAPIAASATSTATSTDSTATQSGGTGGSPIDNSISANQITEAVNKILNYLKSQQASDGKIIDGGITDWAIMAFAGNGEYADDIKKDGRSLLEAALQYDFSDASDLNVCASYPRHILALLAAGVGADSSQIKTMIAKIQSAECYQNNQYGLTGINDDVFALLALTAVGTSPTEPIITDIVAAIIADQNSDGASTWAGWAGADITGATVNALAYAQKNGSNVPADFFDKAKNYLRNQQTADGGWGDPLSTGWAMMGINALGEGQSQWYNTASKNPWHAMVNGLGNGGYYESSWVPGTVDWFATKHAVPALLGKYWPIILPARQNVNVVPAASGSPDIAVTSTLIIPAVAPTITTSSLLTRITPNLQDFSIPTSTEPTAVNETAIIVPPPTIAETVVSSAAPPAKTESPTTPRPSTPTLTEPSNAVSEAALAITTTTGSQESLETATTTAYPELKPLTSTTGKVAEGIFGGSVALAGGLGLYLGWRFLQSLL